MTKINAIQLFENKKVRAIWDSEQEKWYVSIVDVVAALTDSPNPNNYWKVLKNRLKKEGSQLVTDCNQLKMQSSDGKFHKTDVVDRFRQFWKHYPWRQNLMRWLKESRIYEPNRI